LRKRHLRHQTAGLRRQEDPKADRVNDVLSAVA
jgi:hypothetical protein